MANGQRLEPLTEKQLHNVLKYGLIVSAISIIFSVEQLYRESRYLELAIATTVFIFIVLMIRRFN